MTTLQVRIDEKLKKQASKKLEAIGMDLSSAVRVFLNQVVVEDGMPFTPNRTPKEIRAGWDRQVEEAKSTKGYKNATELFKALNIKVNVQSKNR